ncbi:ABC transporter substrate-binding protein [Pseudaminobacter sp. NGMCC 1.201702]|uniref:ABC transporter substrate-binding protein n=1 Tax=Pseudaminobacter sp. NGMCC 1.201702 TaxID=3391825 RepID=UPI0039EE9D17
MTKFRVAATGHSVNYLPEYVAASNGFFEAEGLQVEAVVPNPWDLVLKELSDGTSHAALGGIWVPSMYKDRGKQLVPFAKVSARCPLAIVGRKKQEFAFNDLRDAVMLVPGGNGASPGMFLELLLAEHGVDKNSVKFVQNLSGSMLAELFVGGLGDYILLDPVTALRVERQAAAHIVAPLAKMGGAIPWSVYYSEAGSPGDDAELQKKFVRALNRGIEWVIATPAGDMRDLLAGLFPKADVDDVIRLVNDFRQWGMWDSATIEVASYDRWQQGTVAAYLIDEPIPYSSLVNAAITRV